MREKRDERGERELATLPPPLFIYVMSTLYKYKINHL